jgi:hypothetical protein
VAVDWQAAWEELSAHVAGRPHHGSRDLALTMLEIQARHAFAEEYLPRTLRLYGLGLQEDLRAAARQEPVNQRDTPFDARGGSAAADATGAPALRTTEAVDVERHAGQGRAGASR